MELESFTPLEDLHTEAEVEQEALDAVIADHLATHCTECSAACTDQTAHLQGLCDVAVLTARPHLAVMSQQL